MNPIQNTGINTNWGTGKTQETVKNTPTAEIPRETFQSGEHQELNNLVVSAPPGDARIQTAPTGLENKTPTEPQNAGKTGETKENTSVGNLKSLQDTGKATGLQAAASAIGGPAGAASGNALEVILVRHGETTYNADGRLQGQIDIPLSDVGVQQAEDASKRLMERLKNSNIIAIYCSDLSRTKQTAEPFIKALKEAGKQVPVHYVSELRQMNFGAWEGKTPQEIKDEHNGDSPYDKWKKAPRSADPPGGEKIDTFFDRSVSAIEKAVKQNYGGSTENSSDGQKKSIVIFTHGGVIAAMLNHLYEHDPGNLLQFKIPNAGGPTLEYKDGKYTEQQQA